MFFLETIGCKKIILSINIIVKFFYNHIDLGGEIRKKNNEFKSGDIQN
jgi:hypothetical protein